MTLYVHYLMAFNLNKKKLFKFKISPFDIHYEIKSEIKVCIFRKKIFFMFFIIIVFWKRMCTQKSYIHTHTRIYDQNKNHLYNNNGYNI